ncbi:MAG: hypothetical protein U0176_02475 [Bacteroidia bacterium]
MVGFTVVEGRGLQQGLLNGQIYTMLSVQGSNNRKPLVNRPPQ